MDVVASSLVRTLSPREQLTVRSRGDSVYLRERGESVYTPGPQPEALPDAGDPDYQAVAQEHFLAAAQEEAEHLEAALGRPDLDQQRRARSRRRLITATDADEPVFQNMAHHPMQFGSEDSRTEARTESRSQRAPTDAVVPDWHQHTSPQRLARLKREADEDMAAVQADLDKAEKRLARAEREMDSRRRQLESRERGEQYVERYEVVENRAGDLHMQLEQHPHDEQLVILNMISSGSSSADIEGIDDVPLGSALTHIGGRPAPPHIDQVEDVIQHARRPLRLLFEHVPYDEGEDVVVVAKLTVIGGAKHGQQLAGGQSLFAAVATFGARYADSKDFASDDEGVTVVVAAPPWGNEPFHNESDMRDCAVVVARGRGVPLLQKCRMAQAAGALMVVVVNEEDGPLLPEASPDDDGRDVVIPVVGVPLSAGEHFEAVDHVARLGLQYVFDPEFDSMTIKEYSGLVEESDAWVDHSEEKARQRAEDEIEMARFERQQARERLVAAQERVKAAAQVLGSAPAWQLPLDGKADPAKVQGAIEETEAKARDAHIRLDHMEAEAERKERKLDEVWRRFHETTINVEKERSQDYHKEREILAQQLADAIHDDPNGTLVAELREQMQEAAREHAEIEDEVRREISQTQQSYKMQLETHRKQHQAESEVVKKELAEANAHLEKLRSERNQRASEMRDETRARLDEIETQIAQITGLRVSHDEGRQRHAMAEITRENPKTEPGVDLLQVEAKERADAAQHLATQAQKLMRQKEEAVLQALTQPAPNRRKDESRQQRLRTAVVFKKKHQKRLKLSCFMSWKRFLRENLTDQEPQLKSHDNSMTGSRTRRRDRASRASTRQPSSITSPNDLQSDSLREPHPEPEPEPAPEPVPTRNSKAKNPVLEQPAGSPNTKERKRTDRASRDHATGPKQWKLTAKEGVYLTTDAMKQRTSRVDKVRKLVRGTQILELERRKVTSGEISTRRVELRLRCEVVVLVPAPATESPRLTGWVDWKVAGRSAWKEIPRTFTPQESLTLEPAARDRSPVADPSSFRSRSAAGGNSHRPWDSSDDETEGGMDVSTPIAEDVQGFPRTDPSLRQAEVEQAGPDLYISTSPQLQEAVLAQQDAEARAQAAEAELAQMRAETARLEEAVRSETAEMLLAKQKADADAARAAEAELADMKSRSKKNKKKVPRVGELEVIRGNHGSRRSQGQIPRARAAEAELADTKSKSKKKKKKKKVPRVGELEVIRDNHDSRRSQQVVWADKDAVEKAKAAIKLAGKKQPAGRRSPSSLHQTSAASPKRVFQGSPIRSPPSAQTLRSGQTGLHVPLGDPKFMQKAGKSFERVRLDRSPSPRRNSPVSQAPALTSRRAVSSSNTG